MKPVPFSSICILSSSAPDPAGIPGGGGVSFRGESGGCGGTVDVEGPEKIKVREIV